MTRGDWTERYSRHILLPHVGGDGQKRLLEARVGVVGISPLTQGLIDNLVRTGLVHLELLVSEKQPPPPNSSAFLSNFFPSVHSAARCTTLLSPLSSEYLEKQVKNWDIVIDMTGTRDIANTLSRCCREYGKYYHACWTSGDYGWVFSVDPHPDKASPCPIPPNIAPSLPPESPWDILTFGLTTAVAACEIVSRFLGFERKESLFLLQIDGKQGHYAGVQVAHKTGVETNLTGGDSLKAQQVPDNSPNTPISPADVIDITGETCPMTFVRVKLKLETLSIGSLLTIRLSGADTLENVRVSLENAGQRIVSRKPYATCEEWLVEKVV